MNGALLEQKEKLHWQADHSWPEGADVTATLASTSFGLHQIEVPQSRMDSFAEP